DSFFHELEKCVRAIIKDHRRRYCSDPRFIRICLRYARYAPLPLSA
ncbi:hypothetical protein KIPB_016659, partial [Kipferlia bialata]